MKVKSGNQGEIRFDQVGDFPDFECKPFTEKNAKGYIISHSENGNHHILSGDVEVLERVEVPQGAQILHVIVKDPSTLFQDATTPHEPFDLDPGLYEFRIKREYDPFLEQARRVAD